jgi:glycosyltransferase involved in cell wall biosynthesis
MSAENVQLSVVLPVLDAEGTIGDQLEALAEQKWSEPWELLVVDNGSTDGTLALVKRFRDRIPNLRIVDASDHRGQPYALNVGATEARGRWLAFCDADDVVAPGWLAALGDAVREHEFVAGRLDVEALNEPWLVASRGRIQTSGLQQGRYPPYLRHGSSCCLAVSRDLHLRFGGFDESAQTLFDNDYCYRLQLAGAELHFVPEAVVWYRYRDTFGGIYRQTRAYAESDAWLQRRYGRPEGRTVWLWPFFYWRSILWCLPHFRDPAARGRLAWLLGWQVGRLRGSLKHRVLAV